MEQENADCDEELQLEHPDFLHIDPELITTANNVTNKVHTISVRNGKGIATYYKASIFNKQQDYMSALIYPQAQLNHNTKSGV